jgi:hypothetical protein
VFDRFRQKVTEKDSLVEIRLVVPYSKAGLEGVEVLSSATSTGVIGT